MPIPRYGVYRFQPKDKRLATINEPHYQILGVDASAQLRAAVNARSNQNPPDVLYFVNENLDVPFETRLLNVPMGFKPLRSIPGGLAIDYIQSNLFDIQQMKPLDTDHLSNLLDKYVPRAMAGGEIFAFGQKWGPEPGKPDQYFGFEPGNGVHDIHMNQGDTGTHAHENGPWQDGAMIIHLPNDQWVGIFLAFQSQHVLELAAPPAAGARKPRKHPGKRNRKNTPRPTAHRKHKAAHR